MRTVGVDVGRPGGDKTAWAMVAKDGSLYCSVEGSLAKRAQEAHLNLILEMKRHGIKDDVAQSFAHAEITSGFIEAAKSAAKEGEPCQD